MPGALSIDEEEKGHAENEVNAGEDIYDDNVRD